MDRIRLITHAQKEILLVDCSGCAAAEMFALIDEVPNHVRKYPRESVLLLGDFSNAEFNRDVVERLKVAAVFDRPHLKRSAGLTANLPGGALRVHQDIFRTRASDLRDARASIEISS